MPADPSCAITVRLHPADYLRVRNASLMLDITPERFIRALVLSALEYYDRDNPSEVFNSEVETVFYDRLRKRLGAAEAKRIIQERGSEYAEAIKRKKRGRDKRTADIPDEMLGEYRKLRMEYGAAEAKRMIGEEVKRGRAGAK